MVWTLYAVDDWPLGGWFLDLSLYENKVKDADTDAMCSVLNPRIHFSLKDKLYRVSH